MSCDKPVGEKPWWMGVDQWDGPCECVLEESHDDECKCSHLLD